MSTVDTSTAYHAAAIANAAAAAAASASGQSNPTATTILATPPLAPSLVPMSTTANPIVVPLATTTTNQQQHDVISSGVGGTGGSSIGPTRVRQDARLQRRFESTARLVSPLIHSAHSSVAANNNFPIATTASVDQSNYYHYYYNPTNAIAINNLQQHEQTTNSYNNKTKSININYNNDSSLNRTVPQNSPKYGTSMIPGMYQSLTSPVPSIPYYRSLQYKLRNSNDLNTNNNIIKQVCVTHPIHLRSIDTFDRHTIHLLIYFLIHHILYLYFNKNYQHKYVLSSFSIVT